MHSILSILLTLAIFHIVIVVTFVGWEVLPLMILELIALRSFHSTYGKSKTFFSMMCVNIIMLTYLFGWLTSFVTILEVCLTYCCYKYIMLLEKKYKDNYLKYKQFGCESIPVSFSDVFHEFVFEVCSIF